MKKTLAVLLVITLGLMLSACSGAGGGAEEKTDKKMDVTVNSTGEKVNEDFSQNVNVNRASEYAKNEVVLPVTGIGRSIKTDVKANKNYNIVVMTRNNTNPYMVGMWHGGEQAGKDMGCTVQTVSPPTQDAIDGQIDIMENMIEQGVDAFVIHPSDSKGIQRAVDLANEHNIPVVAIGTCPDTGAFMRTGVDYYETGYLVTKELCEAAGGKGKVILLEGPVGVQNMEERKAGIQDAVA